MLFLEIDDLKRKRIEKYLDDIWEQVIDNPNKETQEFAGSIYLGAIKVLSILGIEIEKLD